MGQYYTITLKNVNNRFDRYCPTDGYKLMEFSWGKTNTAKMICQELIKEGKRVYVVGDYADEDMNKNTGVVSYHTSLNIIRSLPEISTYTADFDYGDKVYYVENISKLLYFKINPDEIFKLFLLCSIGNGQGGGDYSGVSEDEVGTWYGDMIKIVPEEELQSDIYKEYEIEFTEL